MSDLYDANGNYTYAPETRDQLLVRIGIHQAQLDALIAAIERASFRVEIPVEIAAEAEMQARGRAGRGKSDLRLATERERKDAARARKREQADRLKADSRKALWTGPIGGEP